MRGILLVSILALAGLVAFVPMSNAEMAKEGSATSELGYTGTFKAVAMPQERVQMNYEVFGVHVGTATESPFYMVTAHCLGSLHAVKAIYDNDSGFCAYTRPDGDMIFLTYEAKGALGGQGGKGTFTIVGGTGKCTGITGGGEFERVGGFKSSGKGTFQGMNRGKLNWKIP